MTRSARQRSSLGIESDHSTRGLRMTNFLKRTSASKTRVFRNPAGGRLTILLLSWVMQCAWGPATSGQEVKVDSYAALNAVEAVRQGNKLLKEDHPRAALEAYAHAKKLRPEAPEIHFAEGLAHFRLQEFDRAREAFMRASAAKNPGLRNDALYGLATCDHAEALQEGQNPKAALSMLESAMQQYHGVLSRDPSHDAARDANARAAAMWRQLKQQLQPQQQECDGDSDEDQDQKEGEQDQKEGDGKEQKKEQQPSESSQDQDQKPNPKKQEDPSEAQGNEQQQQQGDSKPQEKETGQAEARQAKASESHDETSREQAQRRLREMVQALQQRKKAKPERVPVAIPVPVEKDW
jgi:Ca-activated chloride channel family protein